MGLAAKIQHATQSSAGMSPGAGISSALSTPNPSERRPSVPSTLGHQPHPLGSFASMTNPAVHAANLPGHTSHAVESYCSANQGGQAQRVDISVDKYLLILQAAIKDKNLGEFYPPGHPRLYEIARQADQQVEKIRTQWQINAEIASDIVKLALYDVILYVDDSGSMAFEENGSRIDDLRLILSRVAFATSLFDEDGIQVRFMNSPDQGNGIKDEQQVNDMVSRTKFSGLTPMGRELHNKVLGPLVLDPARSGRLSKPVLVIIITDGQPTGESPHDISNIIKQASGELARNPRYGKGAVAFQFAQIGNDLKAREFLSNLDEDSTIGDMIDCTSNYEVEADEMKRANPPIDLSPDMWLIKLLLGAIDSSYDTKDEKSSVPQGNYGMHSSGQGQHGGYTYSHTGAAWSQDPYLRPWSNQGQILHSGDGQSHPQANSLLVVPPAYDENSPSQWNGGYGIQGVYSAREQYVTQRQRTSGEYLTWTVNQDPAHPPRYQN